MKNFKTYTADHNEIFSKVINNKFENMFQKIHFDKSMIKDVTGFTVTNNDNVITTSGTFQLEEHDVIYIIDDFYIVTSVNGNKITLDPTPNNNSFTKIDINKVYRSMSKENTVFINKDCRILEVNGTILSEWVEYEDDNKNYGLLPLILPLCSERTEPELTIVNKLDMYDDNVNEIDLKIYVHDGNTIDGVDKMSMLGRGVDSKMLTFKKFISNRENIYYTSL